MTARPAPERGGFGGAATGPPVLEMDGIGRSFRGRVFLRSAGLVARSGRVTALFGRNGCGKTTLFRIVVGRVRAEYGRVLYDGRYRPRPRLSKLAAEGLMYSAQESALTAHFTVREHLDAFAERWGGSERMAEVVEALRLGEVIDRRPPTLSGGERQRVSLALARLRRPRCLLSDEPYAGVAPRDRPLVSGALRAAARDGAAVVVSGHDVDDLFAVADEVVWMTAGTTHALGTPEQARAHDQFKREYLGPRGGAAPTAG